MANDRQPGNDEVMAMVLVLEEVATTEKLGERGLRFLCGRAARLMRHMRPEVKFFEEMERLGLGAEAHS